MKRGNVRKFGREFQQRHALIKSLLTGLVEHGRIRTTVAKAKTMRVAADKLVTLAKKGTVASRRMMLRHVGSAAASKMAKDWAPKFATRQGGYTRVLKLGKRASDAAPMAMVEFVQ